MARRSSRSLGTFTGGGLRAILRGGLRVGLGLGVGEE